jgi:UDP-glucuronate decarboxylase
LGPRSCYEEGKRFGEALCKGYHDQYGLDVRIGRLFNSYGPRLRPDGLYGRVVSRFIMQAQHGDDITVFGDGSQTRSFCYVTDTITGVLRLTEKSELPAEAINLGNREETTILELAKKILTLSSSRRKMDFLPFPPGDHKRRLPDTSRAENLLGWSPGVGLGTGLERTLKWFELTRLPK